MRRGIDAFSLGAIGEGNIQSRTDTRIHSSPISPLYKLCPFWYSFCLLLVADQMSASVTMGVKVELQQFLPYLVSSLEL